MTSPSDSADEHKVELLHQELAATRAEVQMLRGQMDAMSDELRHQQNLHDEETKEVDLETGRKLGRFNIHERIGRGGMGEVWRASDAFGNICAVKTLLRSEDANETELQRFRLEAEIMYRLQHRGICRILEVGEDHDEHYIAMEYIHGVSLSQILKHRAGASSTQTRRTELGELIRRIQEEARVLPANNRQDKKGQGLVLPLQQSLSIMIKVCDAVHYAHEHGVLHRDLKGANIMIRLDGEPVVMDFGLAKLRAAAGEAMTQSMSANIVGTIDSMAPEQASLGRVATEQSDVYALGALMYRMVSGFRHFEPSGDVLQDLAALQQHEPQSFRQLKLRVDSDLEVIIMKSLRPEPADRYPSVLALRADLDRFQRGEPVLAKDPGLWDVLNKKVRRHRSTTALIAGFTVTLIIILVWSYNSLKLEKLDAQRALSQFKQAKAAQELAEASQKRLLDRAEQESRRTWLPIFEEDFLNNSNNKAWQILLGRGEQKDEVLRVRGGSPNFLLLKDAFAGDLRLEFDIYLNHATGGAFEVGAVISMTNQKQMHMAWKDAYTFQHVAGSLEIRKNDEVLSRDFCQPLQVKSWHHIRLERTGSHLVFAVDEDEVYADDPTPYSDPARNRIGFISNQVETWFDNIKIQRLSVPIKADVLALAQQNFDEGRLNLASELFQLVIQATQDPSRLRIAEDGLRRANARERGDALLRELHPAIAKLKAVWPQAKIDLRLNPSGYPELSLRGESITNLKPLQNLPLQALHLSYTRVESLVELKGMAIKQLQCPNNKLRNLDGLEGMPLEQLYAQYNQLVDISAIQNCPIKELNLSFNKLSLIDALESMPLSALEIANNRLVSLTALKNCPLESLNVDHNLLEDISALSGQPLILLHCSYNQIFELPWLEKLIRLSASHNQIESLDPVRSSPLTHIDIDNNRIENLDALQGMALISLNLSDNQVEDISPLAGMPVSQLLLRNNTISDLSPLQGLKLTVLDLAGNLAIDLSSLKDMPLTSLILHNNLFEDYSTLSTLDLETLQMDLPNPELEIVVLDPLPRQCSMQAHSLNLQQIQQLSTIYKDHPSMKLVMDQLHWTADILSGNTQSLSGQINLDPKFKGKRLLTLPGLLPRDQAIKIASRLQASLPTIVSKAEQDFLRRYASRESAPIWLGAIAKDDGNTWQWLSQEPWTYPGPNGTLANNNPDEQSLVMLQNGDWNTVPNESYGRVILQWSEIPPSFSLRDKP